MASGSRTILAAALLASLAPGAGAVEFKASVIDANGPPKLWGKGVGDLNGDGRADLVVGSHAGGLRWYENPGWQRRTISASAPIEEDITVADLDGDRRRDVVAVTTPGLTWFRRTADGGWSRHAVVASGDFHDVAVADLDGDGRLDLAARGQGARGAALHVWRQVDLGRNRWAAETLALPTGGEGLTRADLDRDGRNDLVVGRYWFRNESKPGDLSFARHLYSAAAPRDAYLDTGDLNGDGRTDIVAAPSEPARRYHDLLWFEAPPDPVAGAWTAHVIERGVERVTHFVAVADFDRDGHLDVATALTHKARNPRIKLYLNPTGRGSFTPPQIVANTSSHSMKIVEVGSDAGPSLFGADYDNAGRTPVRLFRWSGG